MLDWLGRFWERRSISFPVSCGELAQSLVKEKGYGVAFQAASGRCDWKKRTVSLSYGEERNHLAAVFQAAHEAGHAVHGPTLVSRLLFVFWGIYFVWMLVCFWGGFVGMPWLPIILPMAGLFGIRVVDFCFDELRATRYARRKLERVAPGQKEKSALRVHFTMHCLAHIVISVAFAALLLAGGRVIWGLGAFWGGG